MRFSWNLHAYVAFNTVQNWPSWAGKCESFAEKGNSLLVCSERNRKRRKTISRIFSAAFSYHVTLTLLGLRFMLAPRYLKTSGPDQKKTSPLRRLLSIANFSLVAEFAIELRVSKTAKRVRNSELTRRNGSLYGLSNCWWARLNPSFAWDISWMHNNVAGHLN